MRNLLALIALLALTSLGLGAARGWYSVARQPADAGRLAFRVEVDAVRIGQDVARLARCLSRGDKAEPTPP